MWTGVSSSFWHTGHVLLVPSMLSFCLPLFSQPANIFVSLIHEDSVWPFRENPKGVQLMLLYSLSVQLCLSMRYCCEASSVYRKCRFCFRFVRMGLP